MIRLLKGIPATIGLNCQYWLVLRDGMCGSVSDSASQSVGNTFFKLLKI